MLTTQYGMQLHNTRRDELMAEVDRWRLAGTIPRRPRRRFSALRRSTSVVRIPEPRSPAFGPTRAAATPEGTTAVAATADR